MSFPHCLSLRERSSYIDIRPNFLDLQFVALKGQNASQGLQSALLACKFCTQEDYSFLFALGDEDGKVKIFNSLALHNDIYCKTKHSDVWNGSVDLWKGTAVDGYAHKNTVYDLAWMTGELKLVSVAGDNAAILRDVGRETSRNNISDGIRVFLGHKASVKSVDFSTNKSIFATGGRDGKIMTWDIRVPREGPDHVIEDVHQLQTPAGTSRARKNSQSGCYSSVLCIAFQDEHTIVSCGDRDCSIKVWDLRKTYSIRQRQPVSAHTLSHPGTSSRNYFTSLAFDPHKVQLYAGSNSNNIYSYNAVTFENEPMATFGGAHIDSSYVQICLSPDGDYLLSGSSDSYGYIWNTRPKANSFHSPLFRLSGHHEEVTCVAWSLCPDTKFLTCSDGESCGLQLWEMDLDNVSREADRPSRRRCWSPSTIAPQGLPEALPQEGPSWNSRMYASPRPALRPIQIGTSPTSSSFLRDLPNHVVDGTTPRHVCSPARRTTDWLTRYRRVNSSTEKSPTSTFHTRSSQSTGSKRSNFRPSRRRNVKRGKSLLQYFKPTQKSARSTNLQSAPNSKDKGDSCPQPDSRSSSDSEG